MEVLLQENLLNRFSAEQNRYLGHTTFSGQGVALSHCFRWLTRLPNAATIYGLENFQIFRRSGRESVWTDLNN